LAHSSNGWYEYKGVAADADTLGRLRLKVSDSAVHLPVWQDYEVVSSQFYLSMYSTIPMPVDVTRWGTAALSASAIANINAPANLGVLSIDSSGDVTLSTLSAALTSAISTQVWAQTSRELTSVTVNAFAANAITSAAFAASAIDERAFSAAATSEITSAVWANSTRSLTTLSAALTSLVGRAVWNSTITEPSSGPFEWTGNYGQVHEWLGALSRNQIDQSSVDQILRADSTATIISSARTSGSSTVFVRGEWSS
jgi:hypothetical protein